MPTKIDLHAFHNHFYLHKFFEPILFFDPHGLVIFEGKKEQNLQNRMGHAHQNWLYMVILIHLTESNNEA